MLIRRVRESHKVPCMRLNFISYCRLLPPREIAKSFSANGLIGRGGGDRKHYRAEFQGVRRNAGERQPSLLLRLGFRAIRSMDQLGDSHDGDADFGFTLNCFHLF